MKTAISIVKILLALCSIPIGGYLAGVAYTQLSGPWLNSFVLILGIAIAGCGVLYLGKKIVKSLIKWS